jgi:glycosyltransferase involved in cell wall biosynthesis
MRIVVVTSSPPFVEGGHLVLARALAQALREAGHTADIILTPQNRFGRQGAAYLSTWLTDVGMASDGTRIDQVISLRYPSYAVRHPAHVCWLNHRMREYYDLWDRFSAQLARRARVKEAVRRRLIHAADRYLLTRNVRKLFVQSRNIQSRLQRWGGIRSVVLYPPPPQRPYRCEDYEPYVFCVSRITSLKRVDLLVQAMAQPEAAGVRAVVAGDGDQRLEVERLIRTRGLEDRVNLIGRVSDAEVLAHLARCRAVCFPTFDEDYGFVTVEAFASRKPVITCTDSGGPAELVHDGIEGLVCDPTPLRLAEALRRLMEDRSLAERMGEAARQVVSTMSWDAAVRQLVIV